MTREEAKQWLEAMKSSYALPIETYEAIDMAIEALSAKPPTDLISRADAIDAVRYLIYDRQEKGAKPFKWWFIKQRLNAIPSADAVQGEWVRQEKYFQAFNETVTTYKCSVCGHEPYFGGDISKLHFCPNCGARMKGGDDK